MKNPRNHGSAPNACFVGLDSEDTCEVDCAHEDCGEDFDLAYVLILRGLSNPRTRFGWEAPPNPRNKALNIEAAVTLTNKTASIKFALVRRWTRSWVIWVH